MLSATVKRPSRLSSAERGEPPRLCARLTLPLRCCIKPPSTPSFCSSLSGTLPTSETNSIWSSFFYGNTSSPSIAMAVNYSLYLVTDSTKTILGDRDLVNVVRAALEGGGRALSSTFNLLRLLTLSSRRNGCPVPRQNQ